MQCVGPTDPDARGQPPERFPRGGAQTLRNSKTTAQPPSATSGEISRHTPELALGECPLAPFAMKTACHFDSAERAAMHASKRLGQTADSLAFRFVDIKFSDIRRIEIAHAGATPLGSLPSVNLLTPFATFGNS